MLQGVLKLQETQNAQINQVEYRESLDRIENALRKNSGEVQDLEKLKQVVKKLAKDSSLIIEQSIIKDEEFFLPEEPGPKNNKTIGEQIENFSKDIIKLKRIANAINDPSFTDVDKVAMENITILSNYYKWIDKNTDGFNEGTQKAFENAKFNFAIALNSRHEKLASEFIFSKIEDLAQIISKYKNSTNESELVLPAIKNIDLKKRQS